MATNSSPLLDDPENDTPAFAIHIPARLAGFALVALVLFVLAALASWSVDDPSLSFATDKAPANWLGYVGAIIADVGFQFFGLAALMVLVPPVFWGRSLIGRQMPSRFGFRILTWIAASVLGAGLFSCLPVPAPWPLPTSLGGLIGSGFTSLASLVTGRPLNGTESVLYALILLAPTLALLWIATGLSAREPEPSSTPLEQTEYKAGIFDIILGAIAHSAIALATAWRRAWDRTRARSEHANKDWEATRPQYANEDGQLSEPLLQSDQSTSSDFDRHEPYLGSLDNLGDSPVDDQEPAIAFAHHDQDDQIDKDENVHIQNDSSARQSVEHGSGASPRVTAPAARPKPGTRQIQEAQGSLLESDGFELPALNLLTEPKIRGLASEHKPEKLEANARRLEGVLADFGVKGDIINVRPGPVVTLYELEPAPGIKSSRVISLADDIARSMSAISARVAVVPGRNAIGIELPNNTRETVFLREMLASNDFERMKGKLNICLGKTIGGEPVIADLARMPHLLVAGTTGSGKSVAINTMILSLLYRMTPEQCRMIMIDPKMLELSIYDGIPHLLTPVVTDPHKAVVALKWAVREMEDRYRKMSKIGVRNIDGFNTRVAEANNKGKTISRTVQTGFDKKTGEAVFESEEFDLQPLPYIVVVVDEMADLMMVAGKDIEGAIQRLAQMARAAGIHLITATQRPSVDVITGTIKANFPTRISFQVTSKIDSRTILGEQGAEQLLGMGDMLYMAGGGRIRRLHGPFCSDREVEDVVKHLKAQDSPDYLENITVEEDEELGAFANGEFSGSGDELYDKAVNIVLNDRKASTSYIQRRLSIGYNRAATLIEKMELEGVISPANHAGKREVLVGDGVDH